MPCDIIIICGFGIFCMLKLVHAVVGGGIGGGGIGCVKPLPCPFPDLLIEHFWTCGPLVSVSCSLISLCSNSGNLVDLPNQSDRSSSWRHSLVGLQADVHTCGRWCSAKAVDRFDRMLPCACVADGTLHNATVHCPTLLSQFRQEIVRLVSDGSSRPQRSCAAWWVAKEPGLFCGNTTASLLKLSHASMPFFEWLESWLQ